MGKKCVTDKVEVSNSTEKAVDVYQQQQEEDEEEEEEEEALSLSDLPMIHHNSRKEKSDEEKSTSNIPLRAIEIQQDFDFCSVSKESEMCSADEVFFQGQILPLRHSVSSEKGLHYCGSGSISRSISMSESTDYHSSRSSSISSSYSASTHPKPNHKLPKPPPPPTQNQFHSHPSPSPRLNYSKRHGIVNSNNRNCPKKTSWNIFRLGLVTSPPEIAFQDLKTRCPTNNSKNCNNKISSGNKISTDKKRKPRDFLSGCKCTNDAVSTVSYKIAQIQKRANEGEIQATMTEEGNKDAEPMKPQEQKKQLSHHRTFEWLKQLSIEGPADLV